MPNLQEAKLTQKVPRGLKSAAQNLLVSVFSIALVLAGLEAGLRVTALGAERRVTGKQAALRRESEFVFHEYDRYLGWKNKPGAEGYFTTPDSKTFVGINSKGLRDGEHAYEKPAGVFRVLVLGDSFAWGYGVEQGKNVTDKLERLLDDLDPRFSARGGSAHQTLFGGRGDDKRTAIEVINLGVSGYGTDQELLLLESEGMKYQPDLVLVAFATNDFMFDNRSSRHGHYSKPYFVLEEGELKPMNYPLPELTVNEWEELLRNWKPDEKAEKRGGFKGFLKYKTSSYPFISQGLKNLRYSALRLLALNPSTARYFNRMRRQLAESDADLEVTRKIFLRMKEAANAGGAKLAVLTIPYKSSLEKLPNAHIADFIDFFSANGIPSVYPYEIFYERFKRGEKLFLDHDDHWNENGHKLAAETIQTFLLESHLIPDAYLAAA